MTATERDWAFGRAHRVLWLDCLVDARRASLACYRDGLGWVRAPAGVGPPRGPKYRCLETGTLADAGATWWFCAFPADDLDRAVASAVELGGVQVGTMGGAAWLRDPSGADFGLFAHD